MIPADAETRQRASMAVGQPTKGARDMNMAYRTFKPDDLPMLARVRKRGKGLYQVELTFKQSHRLYGVEIVRAKDIRTARKVARTLYSGVRRVT
jgi:hypothetical protein